MSKLRPGKKARAGKSLNALREATTPGWAEASSATNAAPSPVRQGRPLVIEDIFALRLAGDPSASPDGSRVASTLR